MSPVITVKVVSNRLPSIPSKLHAGARAIVKKAAKDIASRAKENTVRVDTGAMKNGYQVREEGDLVAVVSNSQEYHIYHELGTKFLSPSPMLIPAAEDVRPSFNAAVKQLLERA